MSEVFESLKDKKLIDRLNEGAVGVIPTDTVYGLVCRADNEQAVSRLYGLKQRDHKPGTIVAANLDQLVALGLKARYLKAVEQYWPGPISVVIPVYGLDYLHLDKPGLAVRVPKHPALKALLQQTEPLLTSSANLPGKLPANTMAEAKDYFGDKVDFYVNGSDLSGHEPSTLIRIVDDAIEILRSGAVKINESGEIT